MLDGVLVALKVIIFQLSDTQRLYGAALQSYVLSCQRYNYVLATNRANWTPRSRYLVDVDESRRGPRTLSDVVVVCFTSG